MNSSRTSARIHPIRPAERRVAAGMLLGSAVGSVWAGAMLYTVVNWIL